MRSSPRAVLLLQALLVGLALVFIGIHITLHTADAVSPSYFLCALDTLPSMVIIVLALTLGAEIRVPEDQLYVINNRKVYGPGESFHYRPVFGNRIRTVKIAGELTFGFRDVYHDSDKELSLGIRYHLRYVPNFNDHLFLPMSRIDGVDYMVKERVRQEFKSKIWSDPLKRERLLPEYDGHRLGFNLEINGILVQCAIHIYQRPYLFPTLIVYTKAGWFRN